MNASTLSLDHVGIAVPDLEAGRRLYRALGFTLTDRSLHSGVIEPGGPVVPWGSGNHCAMLRKGYLEVIGLVDASKPSTVARLLKRYAGAHIVALRTPDADAAYEALAAANVPVQPPAALQRALDDGSLLRFRNIYFEAGTMPEARFIVIEHQTPELLWKAELLDHPNTAVSLRNVTVVVAPSEAEATRNRIATLLPAGSENADAIKVATTDTWSATLPGEAPCVGGFEVGVGSISECGAVLAANGVPFGKEGNVSILVDPQFCAGAQIRFIEE